MLRHINSRVFLLIIVSADSLGAAEAVKSASWGARNGKFKLSSTDLENPLLIGPKKDRNFSGYKVSIDEES